MVVLVKNEFYTDGDCCPPKIMAYENMESAVTDMFHDIVDERIDIDANDDVEIITDEGMDGTERDPETDSFWELRFRDRKKNVDGILLWNTKRILHVSG